MLGADRWNAGLEEPLAATIQFAKKEIPHYRATITDFDPGSVSWSLGQVPILTKRTAIRNKDRLRLTHEGARIGRFSTGTTRRGHEYLDVQRIPSEALAVKAFLITGGDWKIARDPSFWNEEAIARLERDYGRSERAEAPPPILHVENLHYEAWPVNEQANTTPVAWTHHPNTIQSIYHLLGEGRFEVLRIESGPLVKLTMLLGERGFDFQSSRVRAIGVYGYLTPRWRRWLESKWRASLVEVFSMSEVRSVARECKRGGHFHFDELPIVTEVVDPVTNLPCTEGQGELVLTTLYPFAQQQPLLRYATGDLVEIVECDLDPRLGFRWGGRLMHASPRADRGYLGERVFLDTLDELPDVERSGDDFEKLGLIATGTLGWPIYYLERNGSRHVLHVRLRYDPLVFSARITELERALAGLADRVVWHGPAQHEQPISRWYSYQEPLYPFSTLLG